MNCVPVSVGDLYGGVGRACGVLRDEGEFLALEYQVRYLDLVSGGVRAVKVPLKDVVSVELERGWFGLTARLVIQLSRLEAVKDVPGMSAGRLELGVDRKDRAAAERFVADLHVPDPPSPPQ